MFALFIQRALIINAYRPKTSDIDDTMIPLIMNIIVFIINDDTKLMMIL